MLTQTSPWQMVTVCRLCPMFNPCSYMRMTSDVSLQILASVYLLFLPENERWCRFTDSGLCLSPVLTGEWQMMPVYRFLPLFISCSYRRMTDDANLQILASVYLLFLPENDIWCQFTDSGLCLSPVLTREWQMMQVYRFWPLFFSCSYRRMTDDASLQILASVYLLFLQENDMMPVYRFWPLFISCSYRRMTDDASLQILASVYLLFLQENDIECQFTDSGLCLSPVLTGEWQMMPVYRFWPLFISCSYRRMTDDCRFWPLFNPSSYRRMTDDASLQALVHVSLDQLFLLAVPVDEQFFSFLFLNMSKNLLLISTWVEEGEAGDSQQ